MMVNIDNELEEDWVEPQATENITSNFIIDETLTTTFTVGDGTETPTPSGLGGNENLTPGGPKV